MRPLDPRLWRRARSARRYVVLTAALGALTAATVVTQALLLARVLAPVVEGRATWADVSEAVAWLGLALAARAALVGVQERYAHRAAVDVVAELRTALLAHVVALGPRVERGGNAAVATLATRGLEALEPYVVRYLPQLLLVATVTPATLAVVLGLDRVAAVTIALTLPLVPLFMALVGWATQTASRRRLHAMERLGEQVLDLLAGLPTLRALGRETGPAARVRALGEAHRRATMGTLRIAFLSGMVLELLTTLAVALVAVGVGMRLVHGGLDLQTALAVLVLAPEVYLPLRQVGAHFHASADGVAAADRVLTVLDRAVPPAGTCPAPDVARSTVLLEGVVVHAPDRAVAAPGDLSARLAPGRVLGLVGPNGAGKSTALLTVLGLLRPDAGRVLLEGPDGTVDLADVDPTTWWPQLAWVPQRPVLTPGTLRDAVAAGRDVPDAALERAAALTGLDPVVRRHGWAHPVGQGGVGLSLGERQRVALARALVATAPLVLLDEPTAHLDGDAAAVVTRTVAALRDAGRTVLLVTHRSDVLAAVDDVVDVTSAPLHPCPAVGAGGRDTVGAAPR